MRHFTFIVFSFISIYLHGQKIGGPCEGCEAIYEYGNKTLMPVDTFPEFNMHKNKLIVTGSVYLKDGKTPAPNVIIYAYHTNDKGIYPTNGDEEGWAKRHGYLRGWTKTDKNGQYSFYTFKPAPYPNGRAPVHIHLTIKEPDKNPYWIDEIVFDNDPLMTSAEMEKRNKRAGSGIVHLTKTTDQLWSCQRDIILGLNIPNYR